MACMALGGGVALLAHNLFYGMGFIVHVVTIGPGADLDTQN